MKKLSKPPHETKTTRIYRKLFDLIELALKDNSWLGATPIGFLLEPVANPFTRIRFRIITWDDMQMSMEYRLPGYGTAIPAQIVALWIVLTINQCFDLSKK